jgi:hypothetical protein
VDNTCAFGDLVTSTILDGMMVPRTDGAFPREAQPPLDFARTRPKPRPKRSAHPALPIDVCDRNDPRLDVPQNFQS